MQQLEKQAYIFCIETIDLIKLLEKQYGNSTTYQEVKKISGDMYHRIADTHKADSNKEFADLLRETDKILKTIEQKMPEIKPEGAELKEKYDSLSDKLNEVKNSLNDILSKIVY